MQQERHRMKGQEMRTDKSITGQCWMEPEKHVGFEIRTLSNLIKRHVEKSETKKYVDNITGVHSWVIGYLYRNEDKDIFQRDLEEKFSIRRSTATAILQLMEKNGLVTRKSVDYDARLKKISLTPKARELQQMIFKDIEQLEERLVKDISEEETTAFFKTIEKIKKNME